MTLTALYHMPSPGVPGGPHFPNMGQMNNERQHMGIEERVRLCLLDEGSAGSLRVRRSHENLVLSVRTHLISLEAAPRPAEMRMQRE